MKKLFIWFTMHVFCKVYEIVLFSALGFEGGMWDLIELIPDHCFSVYFKQQSISLNTSRIVSSANRQIGSYNQAKLR